MCLVTPVTVSFIDLVTPVTVSFICLVTPVKDL
jgi:hypothetical protein